MADKMFWVGRVFTSGLEFEKLLEKYESDTKYTFGTGNSSSMDSYCKKNNRKNDFPPEFPMYDYELKCSQGGKFVPKGEGKRNVPSKRTNCQVHLTARYSVKDKYLEVKKWYGKHNHDPPAPVMKKKKKNVIVYQDTSKEDEQTNEKLKVKDLISKIKDNILNEDNISQKKVNLLEIFYNDLQKINNEQETDKSIEETITEEEIGEEEITEKELSSYDIDIDTLPIILEDDDLILKEIMYIQPSTSRGRPKMNKRPPVGSELLKYVKNLPVKQNKMANASVMTNMPSTNDPTATESPIAVPGSVTGKTIDKVESSNILEPPASVTSSNDPTGTESPIAVPGSVSGKTIDEVESSNILEPPGSVTPSNDPTGTESPIAVRGSVTGKTIDEVESSNILEPPASVTPSNDPTGTESPIAIPGSVSGKTIDEVESSNILEPPASVTPSNDPTGTESPIAVPGSVSGKTIDEVESSNILEPPASVTQ